MTPYFFLTFTGASQNIAKIGTPIKKSPSVCMNNKKKTKRGMHFCGCVKNITIIEMLLKNKKKKEVWFSLRLTLPEFSLAIQKAKIEILEAV